MFRFGRGLLRFFQSFRNTILGNIGPAFHCITANHLPRDQLIFPFRGYGITLRVRYTDHVGIRHSEKVGRFSDAEDLYAKRRHEALLHKKLPESFRNHGVTFEQLVKDALEHSNEQNGTKTNINLEGKLNVLSAIFGKMAASDITKQDIQRWLQEQTVARNWKAGTRNRWQAAFSLVFRVGVDNDKIETNPASRIKRKTENNGRIRFLSDEEETKIRKVLEAKYPQYIPAFDISLHTGMRASEQFGLRWNQIDLERKLLTLPKTKNGSSRVIRLNSVALAAFQQLRTDSKSNGVVFRNTEGEPLEGTRAWFEPTIEETGIENYTWHCNRHTFASRLVMAGVDLRTVADLMGHKTIQMTMRYAHLAPDHRANAVERLVSSKVVTKSATSGKMTPVRSLPYLVSPSKLTN